MGKHVHTTGAQISEIDIDPNRAEWCIARALYVAAMHLMDHPSGQREDALDMLDVLTSRYQKYQAVFEFNANLKEAISLGYQAPLGAAIDPIELGCWLCERKADDRRSRERYGAEDSDLPF